MATNNEKVSEKKLTGYSSEYVKSKPITGGETKALIGDISTGYLKDYSEVVNQVYNIGMGILKVNDEAEQEREYIKVSNSLADLRNSFRQQWDEPESLNFNDPEWIKKRDEALIQLETAERDIIGNSNLHESSIRKMDTLSKEYHRENQLDFDFKRADHNKNVNMDMFSSEIDNKMLLGANARTMAEQKTYYEDVNTAMKGLVRYGVSPAKIQDKILNNLKQVVKINAYKQIKDIMKGATYEDFDEREAQATSVLGNAVRGGMALLNHVEGFSDSDAGEVAQMLMTDATSEIGDYIDQRRDIVTSNFIKQTEIDTNKAIKKAQQEEDARKKQIDEARKIEEETTKYNQKIIDYKNEGKTIELFSHINGLTSAFTVSDVAFNPQIRGAVSESLFGGEFDLVKQGEPSNSKIGNFLPQAMVSEFKVGIEEIEANQGVSGVLDYAKKFAKQKLDSDGYNVTPDEYNKVIEGATYELLVRGGKPNIAQAMKNVEPTINKATVTDNLNMLEMLKRKNQGHRPDFDADKEALKSLDMPIEAWHGFGSRKLNADELRYKTTVNQLKLDLMGRYKLSTAQAEAHAVNFISTIIKNYDGEFYKEFYDLEPLVRARKTGEFINRNNLFNNNEEVKKMTDSYFQTVINPYVPSRKLPTEKPLKLKPDSQGGTTYNFTGDKERNANANEIYPVIKKYAEKYGLDTSTAMGQWAVESAWGTSKSQLAKENYAIFGIKKGSWKGRTVMLTTQEEVSPKAYENDWKHKGFKVVKQLPNGNLMVKGEDEFRAYDSLEESVEDHMKLISKRYRNGLKGYATDSSYVDSVEAVVKHNFSGKRLIAKN